jgi:hypothetical protein
MSSIFLSWSFAIFHFLEVGQFFGDLICVRNGGKLIDKSLGQTIKLTTQPCYFQFRVLLLTIEEKNLYTFKLTTLFVFC